MLIKLENTVSIALTMIHTNNGLTLNSRKKYSKSYRLR